MTITNKSCIHEEMNSRLISGNVYCHSFSVKNLMIKVYKTNFNCCFEWMWNMASHTQIEDVWEQCWGEYLDWRGKKLWEAEKDCIMGSFITCILHQLLLGDEIKEDEMGKVCSMYGRDEIYSGDDIHILCFSCLYFH